MKITPAMFRRTAVVALAVLGLAGLEACETTQSSGPMVQFSITPSRNTALVGEAVTITSQSMNVVGTDSEIEWHTTGGDLQPRQNGRVVQVTFDEPGTYNVSANLISDGVQVWSDTTTIRVNPLRQSPTISREGQRQDMSQDADRNANQELNQRQDQTGNEMP